jgi:hypothetical protein
LWEGGELAPATTYRWQDYPNETSCWLDLLREHRRFLLAIMPVQYDLDARGHLTWRRPKKLYTPRGDAMREAGGFAAYCSGPVFADLILQFVLDWKDAAIRWNLTQGAQPLHDKDTLANPTVEVHLLDAEDGEPVMVKVRGLAFLPPPPEPVLAQPSPAKPRGIAGVLHQEKKKKKKPITL